jgi:hypothetical protein
MHKSEDFIVCAKFKVQKRAPAVGILQRRALFKLFLVLKSVYSPICPELIGTENIIYGKAAGP